MNIWIRFCLAMGGVAFYLVTLFLMAHVDEASGWAAVGVVALGMLTVAIAVTLMMQAFPDKEKEDEQQKTTQT